MDVLDPEGGFVGVGVVFAVVEGELAFEDFTGFEGYGAFEDRAIVDEYVELAVYAAGIYAWGELIGEVNIKGLAHLVFGEIGCIGGTEERFEAEIDKIFEEDAGIDLREGEHRFKAGVADLVFVEAFLFSIYYIAKYHGFDSVVSAFFVVSLECLRIAAGIFPVVDV